jgi:hypothetical protein
MLFEALNAAGFRIWFMTCDHCRRERRKGCRRQLEFVQLTKMADCNVSFCGVASRLLERVCGLPFRSKGLDEVKRGLSLKRAAGSGINTEHRSRVLDQRRTKSLKSQHSSKNTSKRAGETRMKSRKLSSHQEVRSCTNRVNDACGSGRQTAALRDIPD